MIKYLPATVLCGALMACATEYNGEDHPPPSSPATSLGSSEVEVDTLSLKATDLAHFKKEFRSSFKPVDRSLISVSQYVGQQQKALRLSSGSVKKLYLSLAFEFLCPSVPTPDPVSGWGPDDEAGNTNTQGSGTACRAGILQSYMNHGKLYKLDHVMTNNSPMSPFAADFMIEPIETFCLENTRFCGHSEYISGEIGGQGTQLDFFGHAGLRPTPASDPSETSFYNGFTAAEVFDGALSADAVNPINGIGILLDARSYLGNGTPLTPDRVITKEEVEQMIAAHDLDWLGLKPGMTVFIYTGKAEGWTTDPYYYFAGPGIRVEVVTDLYIPNGIVYHGLDNPFSDQAILNPDNTIIANSGDDLEILFPIHANALMNGILQSQNLNLSELAADHVYLFSIQLSAPRIAKAKGAMVSPQVYGEPWMNQAPTM